DDALARLTAAGVEVLACTAYHTRPRATDDPAIALGLAAIRARRAPVVALFAPSQVAALCALVPDAAALLRDAVVAAIGATTAAALAAHGLRADAVAASPDPAAMARALAAVYPPR
ncbi:MAG: uroporphyrinogen-III synthase, partial [Deltaproteobacteria bacterium]|nr:uroporphyrinogen-III synthase [Deltaproteobacteria bacterium]